MKLSRKKVIKIGVSTLMLGLSLAIYVGQEKSLSPTQRPLAQLTSGTPIVSHVYDGDTIEVTQSIQKFKIRLIGIDTPEVVDPRKPVQCFGEMASAHTKHLLPVGTQVRLEYDDSQGNTDKYGRTLAYVYLPSGVMLNRELVADGFAHEYTYNNNPYKYQADFLLAQKNAQSHQLGLWSPSTCNGDTSKAAH